LKKLSEFTILWEIDKKTIDRTNAEENIKEKKSSYSHRLFTQNLSLEDYVVMNMTKIIIIYKSIYSSLPILRLNSRIHWLSSIKGIMKLVLSQISHNGTILDVGCGMGHLSALLSMSGHEVVGIDINSDNHMWKYLSKKNKCQFIRADSRYLPLVGKEFDVIMSYAVLEHLGGEKNEQSYLSEIHRVLKTEGKFVMGGVPNKYSLTEIMGEHHERKFTKESIIEKLESSSLYPIYIENEYFLPQYLPTDLLNSIWNLAAFQVVKIDKYLKNIPLYHSNFLIAVNSNHSTELKTLVKRGN
jgi:ubiquinone/menaquinone biosynthesis C-methylase UbiE